MSKLCFQYNCVRVESRLEATQRKQGFHLLKDDELMMFCPYCFAHNEFMSETCSN